jgi:hypothetical protein
MDHVRPLLRLDQELECGLGECGKALDIVVVTIKAVATEEVLDRMRLNKEALSPVHMAEPNRAAQLPSVPGRSEIVVGDMKIPYVPIAHARVLWQHDLHRMPPDLELAT